MHASRLFSRFGFDCLAPGSLFEVRTKDRCTQVGVQPSLQGGSAVNDIRNLELIYGQGTTIQYGYCIRIVHHDVCLVFDLVDRTSFFQDLSLIHI